MPERVNYNPDILSCLANLSNDEVFTPPEIANAMLDMVPQELFCDPNAKFLDPACKSGVFLREIVKRLNKGLETIIPDREKRMEYIMKKQVFGVSITELTALLSRRSLYCSKDASSRYSIANFKDTGKGGNIRYRRIEHNWVDGKCTYCGASRNAFDRGEEFETHAYEFIHGDKIIEVFEKMKFDLIISNPPYQLADGGAGPSSMPIYQLFVKQAMKLKPRFLSMIIPSRWFAGGKGLEDFRKEMINDNRLRELVDFESSKDCFEGVNIAGGVCYFLWDRDHSGKCCVTNVTLDWNDTTSRYLNDFDIFIRSNKAIPILKKVLAKSKHFCNEIALTQKPFGFRTYARGGSASEEKKVRLLSSDGWGYVSFEEIEKNVEFVDKYKVIVGRLVPGNGEVDIRPGEGYKVITKPQILKPGEINTESYITIGTFQTSIEALNYSRYVSSRFCRFLIRQAVSSVNINKDVFKFVPLLNFNQDWDDEKLFSYFNFSKEEIDFIDYMIYPMEKDQKDE